MATKELRSEKLYQEFSIFIPYKELDNLVNKKISELIPTVTLPGFRKGKAPLNIVKKKYENNVLSEAVESLVQEKTKKIIDEKKIIPLRQPKVEIVKYKKDEDIEVKLKIDLKPEINLVDFKKVKVKKYELKIEKKDYDENYKNYIQSQKTYTKLDSSQSIKMGDKAIINIKSENKLTPDFLKDQKNFTLFTDTDFQILPDISRELIKNKSKSGDKIKLTFDLKEILKTKDKTLIDFEIEILSIEEKKDFVINKDFLEKNKLKSEKELKDRIKDNLEKYYNSITKEIEKKQLLDLLEKKHNFDIPTGIYQEEFNLIWQRLKKAKEENNIDEDDKKLSEKELEKRYKEIASRRVKLAILIQTIAEKNTVKITEKELTDGLIAYASNYPGQEKQIFEFFKNNPAEIERIRGPIYENKVLNGISDQLIKEKQSISIKDLKKLQEQTFSYREKN